MESEQEFIDWLKQNISDYEAMSDDSFERLISDIKYTIIDAVIGPFGLTGKLAADKYGGNVTTQHNAEQDIFAKECEKYNRKDYETTFKKFVRDAICNENKLKNNGVCVDEYTGLLTELAEVDHCVAVKAYHSEGGWMQTIDQRDSFGSDPKNLVVTDRAPNRSMREHDIKEWENYDSTQKGITNKEKYSIDDRRVNPRVKKAKAASKEHLPTNAERAAYYGETIVADAGKQAMIAAIKGALLYIFYRFFDESINFISEAISKYKKDELSLKVLINMISDSLSSIWEKIVEESAMMFDCVKSSAFSAALSSIITTIINCFLTTSKKIVTMLREIFVTVGKTVTVLTSQKINVEKDNRVSMALDVLQKGCIACIGIALSEAIATALRATIFAPLSDDLSNMISYFLIGTFCALMIYIYNSMIYRNKANNAALTAAFSSAIINQFEFQSVVEAQKEYENNVINNVGNQKVSEAIQAFKERKNMKRGYFDEK